MIVDAAAVNGRDLAAVARQAIRGGADVLQLRHKDATARELIREAEALLAVTRPQRIPLIINDRVDVALATGADGVHLGQDDLPVAAARKLLGQDRLIGKSTHSLAQAREATAELLDYVAFGPLYATPTKPDYPHVGLELIRQVRSAVRQPLVTIGGIDATTLPQVLAAGAGCVAVVRAVCAAADPEAAARGLQQAIAQFRRAAASA